MFDVHSRRILGWRAATSMRADLVLDCLEMALWTRRTEDVVDLSGLVRHHTDAGSQYTSIAFTDRLLDHGIDASGSTRPSSSAPKAPGRASTTSRPPPWTGSTGSTPNAPRIHRRSHPGRSRSGLLQSSPTPSRRGLRHETQSPDMPGRLRL
ncbi:DDE-type integrase/transposase/recombinase [Cellulosimicrobium sp. 22601]|uniref:DDE-type integrase/transposase/recombinase n=1 Tax=unclassified Cellulosimicrobium TaxID=2624466 RepID=UPI003F847D8E